MLPAICASKDFVVCDARAAEQYCSNSAVVDQLLDAVRLWTSHLESVLDETERTLDAVDRGVSADIVEVLDALRVLEVRSAFHVHFHRPEVMAVTRVLSYAPQTQQQRAQLDSIVAKVREINEALLLSIEAFELAASYFEQEWTPEDVPDTLTPLFSALRALWGRCTLFGSKHPTRFASLVVGVIHRVESCVGSHCGPTFAILNGTWSRWAPLQKQCVAAQDCCISLQEQYYAMVQALVSLGHSFDVVDRATLFAKVEWQFERLGIVLQLMDAVKQQPERISATMMDDVLSESMTHDTLLYELVRLERPEEHPTDIMRRIAAKQQHLAELATEEAAAVTENQNHAATVMVCQFSFCPPTITFVGGFLTQQTLDRIAREAPRLCSNSAVPTSRVRQPLFLEGRCGARVLEIPNRFCDEVGESAVMHCVLEAVERDGWITLDSHGVFDRDNLENPVYTFAFERMRIEEQHSNLEKEREREKTKSMSVASSVVGQLDANAGFDI